MTNRQCSLCGECYSDETGHNYNNCVERCKKELYYAETNIGTASVRLNNAQTHLTEARRIQKQDWWKAKSTPDLTKSKS